VSGQEPEPESQRPSVKRVSYRQVPEDGTEVTSPEWAGFEGSDPEDLQRTLQWLEERNWDRAGQPGEVPHVELEEDYPS